MIINTSSYRHFTKPCPKHHLICLTLITISSLSILISLETTITRSSSITISYQDPPLLLEPSKPHLSESSQIPYSFSICPKNFTNYLPCHDPTRARRFSLQNRFRRERHCPESVHEKVRCLVPNPNGYRTPFSWPESRDNVWFKNVPFKKLVELKKTQNWVRLEGDRFVFPGGGTSFPEGVEGYVDVINGVLPLSSGSIRTALDIGCGVASFGAFLQNHNILTMSIAPRDIHEAQVQLALERGIPAMLGVLNTFKLPFPSSSFDMVHCSRCLINWTANDGLYLMEVDRILRPGGYMVLSGPPVTHPKVKRKKEGRDSKNSGEEKDMLEEVSRRICWEKISERHPVAIWRKPSNHLHCSQKLQANDSPRFCTSREPEIAWYSKMEPCITRLEETSAPVLKNWPERLNDPPRRIKAGKMQRTTLSSFTSDIDTWQRRVLHYDRILKFLGNGKYRNIMDMNAGFGGFSAALVRYPVWVMNVVPFDAKPDTLGIVYDRGLIGTYMNWCEAFSTYPRTCDLVHANGLLSMYLHKCDIVDILIKIHRILRPRGAVIIRDRIDVVIKAKIIVEGFRWNGTIYSDEDYSFDHEKILIVDNSVIW
ncbi:PREDICTED: probable methyltransferase PMT19 [Tarenaya hassleriana]|uniref:probable methyltransferase PMT19 n=1 Tax=Tarenaya hassleriana TaxID=28532 RepID=UPI00053C1A1D|nr:PREDICTED: probable methyltransferase PMT19 [Tarenaya hassleriana]